MENTLYLSRRIEWSPIIAGSILACAVSFMLMQFGHALGLSFTNLYTRETITPMSFMAFGLWALWVQLLSSVTGAYLAGRMLSPWDASHESELRDGAHGLMVWALSSLMIAVAVGVVAAISSLVAQHGVAPKTTIPADMAKRIAIVAGFALAAISLVSAAASWIVASHAGDHRDRKVNVSKHTSFRVKRTAKRA